MGAGNSKAPPGFSRSPLRSGGGGGVGSCIDLNRGADAFHWRSVNTPTLVRRCAPPSPVGEGNSKAPLLQLLQRDRRRKRLDAERLVDLARVVRTLALDDQRDLADVRDVPGRIAVDEDEVGALA